MNSTPTGSVPMVYGFLDETTQVFYAFESREQYQLFVEWMEQG
jgi:hypothetical protein